jgi:hypothetical protein
MLPLLAGSALEAADELPAVTHDGLHLVPGTEVAAAYVKPGADFGVYDRILLVDAYVAFKKGWMQQQNQSSLYRVTNRDVENIKEAMAELFREVFEEELAGGNGYPVVDVPDTDVLLLRPAIIDLDVTAPDLDRGTRSYNFAASAGAATLYLELYDSVSGEILARVLDRQEARSAGDFMRWTNEMTNRAAAREVLAGWASLLRDRLDEIHARAGEENGGESTPEE